MDDYISEGCKFEYLTDGERYRARTYGDEKEFLQLFLQEINSNDVVFDIGSCIGLYTIHAAKRGAFVVAFEPEPNFNKRLKRNVKINNLKNRVEIHNWAVSNRLGSVKLYTDGISGSSPSLNLVGERGFVYVEANSIDNAIKSKNLKIPNIIKLDIEGAEMYALLGMQKVLSSENAPRLIFIEIHPDFLKTFNYTQENVETLIANYGYKKIYHADRRNEIHCIYTRG